MSENPIASILILCHDNQQYLSECLASISRTVNGSLTPFEVIVLFQQTSSGRVESFLRALSGIRVITASLNLGFAAGNNFASRYARGKHLVFLNDDTITQDGWLEQLVSVAEHDEQIGAVGSRLLFPDGTLQEAGAILWSDGSAYPLGRGEPLASLSYTYTRDVDYISANGLLVRRSAFDAAGGFDERFFPGYYEDVDLCMTIRHNLGLRIVYEPRSCILHHESATSNRDPDFRSFLFNRHQSAFRSKWADVLPWYPAPNPESPEAVERAVFRARGNPKRVLVMDDRLPQVGLGSGFGRTADMLFDLSRSGYAIDFIPTDRGHLPKTNLLGDLGVDVVTEPVAEHLARLGRSYDVVIISRPHNFKAYHATVRATMPEAPVIYDAEALYHRRLFLQAQTERDAARRDVIIRDAEQMQDLEIEIARSADAIVAISDAEVTWIEGLDEHAPVAFMRPLSPNIRTASAQLDKRAGAVFVAGWLAGEQSPNVHGLKWYAEKVVPIVRDALPDFVTSVTGANPPLSVQALQSSAVVLCGFRESMESLYSGARIAIAPILVGAGVKIKTIEAMQYGVPVVATAVGAEGLGLSDNMEIDISDDAATFAGKIIALACDDELWLRRREVIAKTVTNWESERLRWSEVVEKVVRGTRVLVQ